MEFSTVDIFKLIKKTMAEFAIQARNMKMSLDLVTDCDVREQEKLWVVGDDIRLTQIRSF